MRDDTAARPLILGTGVDMEQISRVRALMERSPFLARFFGEEEREWLAARGNPPGSVTGSFCAKEAFAKAMGTGIRGFSLREVQVLRDERGAPYYRLDGAAARLAEGMRFSLSLSHAGDSAIAMVVAWRTGE